ncbi:hypothetical protein [Listeria booriae]|uniref:hypothetical protein n=1 Tax=Listeria booriae TaxID=1552123 RepID=UPI00162AC004|nr:hypothetical protein [Listeria booriae]MBC2069337.1 hypothetical protein [Listeria booriae]
MVDDHIKRLEQQIRRIEQSIVREKQKQRKARTRRLIQKGALLEKYFECDQLNVEETEKLLKIFASSVNEKKPDKYKKTKKLDFDNFNSTHDE